MKYRKPMMSRNLEEFCRHSDGALLLAVQTLLRYHAAHVPDVNLVNAR